MARYDIMPFKSPLGGIYETRTAPLNASETFQVGELIFVNTDGEAAEFPQDGTQAVVADAGTGGVQVGIACFGPGAASSAADTTSVVTNNYKTGAAMTTGAEIAYWPADQGILFITDNIIAAGGTGAGTPNGADRGVLYQITYENAATPDIGWGVEQTAGTYGTDVCASIVDVLDSQKAPVGAAADGTYYVFEIKTAA